MRALRAEHARGDELDPRRRLRALAERFPGALRELDELPLAVIEERIAALEAVERSELPAPRWARALASYHAWMRAALALRRAAGVERAQWQALEWLREWYRPEPEGPSLARLEEAMDAVLRPPGGRLNRWVFGVLARELGETQAQVESLLFPYAHRSSSSRLDHGA